MRRRINRSPYFQSKLRRSLLPVLILGLSAYVVIKLPGSDLYAGYLFSKAYVFDHAVGIGGAPNLRYYMIYGAGAPKGLYKAGLKYFIQLNNLGFRQATPVDLDQIGSARAARKGILCVGDSLLFGQDLGPGDTIPQQLQKRLTGRGKAGEKYLIWNASLAGSNTTNVWLKSKFYINLLKPDALIISASENDFEPACDYTVSLKEKFYRDLISGIRPYRACYALLRDQVKKAFTADCRPQIRIPVQDCVWKMRQIIQWAGDIPVIILTTDRHEQEIYQPFVEIIRQFDNVRLLNCQKLLRASAGLGAFRDPRFAELLNKISSRFVDPDTLKKSTIYGVTSDGAHPNEIGALIIAETLDQMLLEMGL